MSSAVPLTASIQVMPPLSPVSCRCCCSRVRRAVRSGREMTATRSKLLVRGLIFGSAGRRFFGGEELLQGFRFVRGPCGHGGKTFDRHAGGVGPFVRPGSFWIEPHG